MRYSNQGILSGGTARRRAAQAAAILVLAMAAGGSGIAASRGHTHAGPRAPEPLYGVIEVGSKGVKSYIFNLAHAEHDPSCRLTDESYLKCLGARTLQTRNVNPIEDGQKQATVDAVVAVQQDLMAAGVTERNLYVVGSSGVAVIEQKDSLAAAINSGAHLAADRGIDFIDENQEATYAFRGLMSMLPARYEAEREQEAMVLDFGSGNTKGSYKDITVPDQPLVTFSVNWGTKTVTDRVNKDRGNQDFVTAAETFRESTLLPLMRQEFDNKPGATERPRIYIIGGISWALSNLSQPANKARFARVTQDDIDSLYDRLKAADAQTALCANNPSQAVNTDIKNICTTFSINNMISGMQLIKGYAQEMNFAHKCVYFFRDSLFAWPMGYLRHKLNIDRTIANRVSSRRPFAPLNCT
jgi:hypothetical protein